MTLALKPEILAELRLLGNSPCLGPLCPSLTGFPHLPPEASHLISTPSPVSLALGSWPSRHPMLLGQC